MKIWILTSETTVYNAGGIARYVDNFASLLAANGVDITVIARGSENADTITKTGYRLIQFRDRYHEALQYHEVKDPRDHPGWPYTQMAYFSAFSLHLSEFVLDLVEREGAPDVIECQEYAGIAYFLLLKKLCGEPMLSNVPILLHLHTPDFINLKTNEQARHKLPMYWIGRMEQACIWMSDALLSPSHFLAEQLQQFVEGALPPIETVAYPLPEMEIPEASTSDEIRFILPGRVELRKGVEKLLEVCDNLWSEGQDFILELIGGDVYTLTRGGSLEAYLKNRYKKYIDDGKLVFSGELTHSECIEKMSSATAVVIPSLWENFPNTCIEAMRLKKLVIVSNQGGQAEMVGDDGLCGLVGDWAVPGSFEALFRKVLAMTNAERLEMGRRAEKRITQVCSGETVLALRLAHYKRIISLSGKRALFPFNNESLRTPETPAGSKPARSISWIVRIDRLSESFEERLVQAAGSNGEIDEIVVFGNFAKENSAIARLEKRLSEAGGIPIRLIVSTQEVCGKWKFDSSEQFGDLLLFHPLEDEINEGFLRGAKHVLLHYGNVHLAYPLMKRVGNKFQTNWSFDLPMMLCFRQDVQTFVIRRETLLSSLGGSANLNSVENHPHSLFLRLAEDGKGGVGVPVFQDYQLARSEAEVGEDERIVTFDMLTNRFPDLFRKYGLDLFNLLNSNGSAYYYQHPVSFKTPNEVASKKIEALEVANKTLLEKLKECENKL